MLPFTVHDLYGYLVPGLITGALIGVPSGVFSGSAVVWSILLGLSGAYVGGMLLAEVTRAAVWRRARRPADALLDEGVLPPPTRAAYLTAVQDRFGLNLATTGAERTAALQQARTALGQAGVARPADRLRALQALHRGLHGGVRVVQAWALGVTAAALGIPGLLLLIGLGARRAIRTGVVDRYFDAGSFFDNEALRHPLVVTLFALGGFFLTPYAGASALVAIPAGLLAVFVLEVAAMATLAAHQRFADEHVHEVVRGFIALHAGTPAAR